MLLDTLLNEIPEGWLVNQLHQLDDGSWRCNFRSAEGELYTNIGLGSTPSEAMDIALDAIPFATHHPSHTPTHSIEQALDLNELLFPGQRASMAKIMKRIRSL